MKRKLLIILLVQFISIHIYSQNSVLIKRGNNSSGVNASNNSVTSCACWLTRDSTWSVAPFDGSGVSGGPGVPPDYRCDDWSTDSLSLPFNFCFYGDTIKEVYINNNGNISFGGTYSTYTALSFPDSTYRMIAPFWSDVDTRDSLSGIVYFKITSQYMVVQWDHVGYFNMHSDKLNTYQLIISDGISSILPENKNVGFCYKDMEWTTGDASSGINGFGGTPATAGVNYGDGINYLQIGLYDDSTFAYDGPYGSNDGVKSLSNQSFVFNVCTNSFNVAPILSGDFICDTINLCIGDTFSYSASFISPEQNQITTVTTNNHGLTGVNLLTSPGNQASIFVSFVAAITGLYNIDIIGTDDGSPAATTIIPLYFNIQNCTTGIFETNMDNDFIYPNPVNDELYLSLSELKNNITVTDISGRIIFNGDVLQKATLNTAEWKQGIYFIRIKSPDNIITRKIIKE